MARAAGGPIKELCEEATCPICLDFFKDPVTLDCGHNFCHVCLSQHSRGFGMALSCPQCRETDQRRSFRPNRQLANVVELVKKLQEEKRAEGKWQVCKRHQAPLNLFCEDDQDPICMACDRSKEHRGHSVLPLEEASQGHKVSQSNARACSVATQYLKMDMPKLIECCQQKGLESRGLSVEELRVLLIQQASQPEQDMVKLKVEELEEQKRKEPREREQFQAQKKMSEAQLTAQAEQRKHELELLQLRKKEPGKTAVKSFTPFSPGGNPVDFLSAFERAAQKQGVPVDDYMEYLPSLIRGELVELYHNLPNGGCVTYQDFKEAVFKQFQLRMDRFATTFRSLQPQVGKSFLEFGVKLEEALNKWLDGAMADNREKVLQVIALDQFCARLPSNIQNLVKAKAPKDVFQAAEIADQLMNRNNSERRTPHFERSKGFQKGGWEEAPAKQEKGSLPIERKRAPNVSNFKEKACYHCGEVGHLKANCPRLGEPVYRVTACCKVGHDPEEWGIMETVLLKGQKVRGLVSTGADISLVRTDLVSPSDIVTGESFIVESLTGERNPVPVARLPVEWRGWTGLKDIGVVEDLFAPVLIGRDLLVLGNQFPAFTYRQSQSAEWEGIGKDTKNEPKGKAKLKQPSMGMRNRPAAEVVESTGPKKRGNWAVGENTGYVDSPVKAGLRGISSAGVEDPLLAEGCDVTEEEGIHYPDLPEGCTLTEDGVLMIDSILDLPEGFGIIMDPNDDDYMSQGLLHMLRQSAAEVLKEAMEYEGDDI
ncbi:uncharacterized protein LOC128347919 [Hemicordylus capensis]|uniref:uncharacterized protein LOC128347919 n=1 Tax=Hemicordylus capensis TaxID=884348 RepID=UPI002304A963|nr:uncharacterized protein LOC128347919 [Hemicordylus capensis]XP_053159222.1 uncharacterized protein LOC128347919 [Hemicordylus capensis]